MMQNMDKLPVILFTSAFPFGNGEQFVEAELKYLSEAFDPIYIFPYYYGGNRESRKHLPHNVTVYQPFRDDRITPVKLIIKGLFNFTPLFPYIGEIIRKPAILLKRKRISHWFRSLLHCRMILNDKRLKKIIDGSKTKGILYFYWGHRPAGITAGLKNSGWKTVVRFHGTDLYEEMPLNYGYIPFQHLVLNSIRHVVCVSGHGVNYLQSKYDRFSGEVALQRLGTTDYGQSSWEWAPAFRIVTCSVVDENKQVLRLAAVLGKLNTPIEWTHVGDGPLMAKLKAGVELLRKDHIRVNLTGRLSNREVHELYQTGRFDVFINISKSEGVPFSIMEALSHAIPVMATAVGGTPEIVDTSCGILLPARIDDAELIKQLNFYIVKLVPRMKELKEGARRRWEESCNAEANYRNFIRFLVSDGYAK